jgi:hypothetical protein
MTVRTSIRRSFWISMLILAANAIAFGAAASQPAIAAEEGSPIVSTAADAGQAGPAAVPAHSAQAATPNLNLPDALSYNDCSGATPLAATSIYRDVCLPGVYLVAHNPGPFTSILRLRAGSLVSYQGRVYEITSVTRVDPAVEWIDAQVHPAALILQTCSNDAHSRIWVFRASAA